MITATNTTDLRWDLPLIGSSPKTEKGVPTGDHVGIVYMSPSEALCPWRSQGCAKGCLVTAGRGAMNNVQSSRLRKRRKFESDPLRFAAKIAAEADRAAAKIRGTYYLRCNGTSDSHELARMVRAMLTARNVTLYDYTKCPPSQWQQDGVHRTFSRTEDTPWHDVADYLDCGISVAIVAIGATHEERVEVLRRHAGPAIAQRAIDGTLSDVRTEDPLGSVVLLRALGKAKLDRTGFVLR
jgi:hypothetical protein